MRTTKFILFGALGVAAVLLLTSERARKIRVDLEDQAKTNADKWKEKLASMGNSANKSLAELRELLDSNLDGITDEAKERIEKILNKSARSANGLKKNISNQFS
jgi:DNA anti-recombination protein RmuC